MFIHIKRSLATLNEVTKSAFKIAEINLVGRDYVTPTSLSNIEIKSLLWTAMDLKYLVKQRCSLNVQNVKDARITLLLDKPSVETQLPINNAASLLNTSLSVIIDPNWDKTLHVEDYGRMLATSSDIIFCKSDNQLNISKLADGSNIPVIAVKSTQYDLMKPLIDVMTLQLHFNHLKKLTVAWVGLPDALMNAYMCILPRLGMNLKYFCVDSSNSSIVISPLMLATAFKYGQQNNTEVHQCSSPSQAIYRADVIVTSAHQELKSCIKMKDVKEAAINWAFLHALPRGENEVEKDVFEHQNSLVWKSIENSEWIYSAFILKFLTGYTHVIQPPDFDNIEPVSK